MDERSDDAVDAVLDALVLECLDALEERGTPAVEQLCAAHPDLAPRLRARLAALGDAGMLTSADALPGRLGPFRIERRLGGGGMGVVYAAMQEPLERRVALKVVRADQLYFPGAKERFRREVQLVARLAHASIAPVYSVGEHDGVPYFAMEHLQGATLAEVLAQLDRTPRRGDELAHAVADVVQARDGERPHVDGDLFMGSGLEATLRMGRRIAEALAHAHSRGVLHRDVKPSNVMLTTDGRVLLFDFGLASSARASRLTRSGSRLGSLAYMSPEQARGDEGDERSDVYGLGALLCEALTLRPPHSGTPEVVTAALLRGDSPEPLRRRGALPRDVVTVLRKALDPDPARRYAGAEDLGRDLGHVLEHRPIEARPAGPALRTLRWTQRHPARAAALVLAVLLPLTLAVQQTLAGRRQAELADSREQALVELRAESARAEANLEHALEAIDVFVLQVGRDAFQSLSHSDGELVASLRGAQRSLEDILAQRPDDAALRGRLVRVLGALGRLHYREGDLVGAEEFYRQADAHLVGRELPPRVRVPVLDGLGLLQQSQGEWAASDATFAEALQSLADAEHTADLCDVANLERLRVRSLLALGHTDEARAAADRAVLAAERALDRAGEVTERLEASLQLGGALARRRCWTTRPPAGPSTAAWTCCWDWSRSTPGAATWPGRPRPCAPTPWPTGRRTGPNRSCCRGSRWPSGCCGTSRAVSTSSARSCACARTWPCAWCGRGGRSRRARGSRAPWRCPRSPWPVSRTTSCGSTTPAGCRPTWPRCSSTSTCARWPASRPPGARRTSPA